MPRWAAIKSSELFDRGNNPGLRLDASYGIALGNMMDGVDDPNPLGTVEGFFKNRAAFESWLRGLRKLETVEEVENHIGKAFTGRGLYGRNPERGGGKAAVFSPKVRSGISVMARKICRQESEALESSIAEDLAKIARLKRLAETPVSDAPRSAAPSSSMTRPNNAPNRARLSGRGEI